LGAIVKRLARVAGFYACAAALGATAVVFVALLSWASNYFPPVEASTLLLSISVLWGIFLCGCITIFIYHATLTMHEDERLFLDDTEARIQEQQSEMFSKVNRVTRYVGLASGTLTLMLALVYVFAYYSNTN
jgi:Fe2+ transport system protein B